MNTNNLYFYVLLLMLLGQQDGNGNTCIGDNCLRTLLVLSLLGNCNCNGNGNGTGCGCNCT